MRCFLSIVFYVVIERLWPDSCISRVPRLQQPGSAAVQRRRQRHGEQPLRPWGWRMLSLAQSRTYSPRNRRRPPREGAVAGCFSSDCTVVLSTTTLCVNQRSGFAARTAFWFTFHLKRMIQVQPAAPTRESSMSSLDGKSSTHAFCPSLRGVMLKHVAHIDRSSSDRFCGYHSTRTLVVIIMYTSDEGMVRGPFCLHREFQIRSM